MPKSNQEYWSQKIARNVAHDKEVTNHLTNNGWKVIRVWTYDLKANLCKELERILSAIDVHIESAQPEK